MRAKHLAVVAPPLAGHYDPLRVLGQALVRRGHRITFVHLPEAAALVPEAELGFGPVGAEGMLPRYIARLGDPTGWRNGRAMIRATAAQTALLLDTLPNALRALKVQAVLADSTEPAGALVARHLRLPFVTTVTGLPLLREDGVPPPFVDWAYRGRPGERTRNRGGWRVTDLLLRPIRQVVQARAADWGLDPERNAGLSPLLQIAQCPPALDFPRAELPELFAYCGPWRRTGATELPPGDGRPLVYCSLGSLQGARAELWAEMTTACATLGARAVVAHGGRLSEAEAATLPGEPLVRAFWHQPSILPHCAAAVLHAGFNTVVDALAAGVPMVVLPIAFEQPGTAARVEWTGAGIKLPPGSPRLPDALGRVLREPGYRRAAQQLANEIAELGGVEFAADLVVSALGETASGAVPTMASRGSSDADGGSRRSGSR